MAKNADERRIALLFDFENIALGCATSIEEVRHPAVLDRLLEKGSIVVKKAYADWTRFSDVQAARSTRRRIELIEIPKRRQTGKNSADIRLFVDAMDLA